jgi:hypothetical protein
VDKDVNGARDGVRVKMLADGIRDLARATR